MKPTLRDRLRRLAVAAREPEPPAEALHGDVTLIARARELRVLTAPGPRAAAPVALTPD